MTLRIPDYLRKAKKASEKEGWEWQYRGTKHVLVLDDHGQSVTTVSLTAHDGVLRKKVESQLRRANCPGM